MYLPLFVFPKNSFTINLPFPLIVIISFCFICFDGFVSFFPFINTLSCSIMFTAFPLEVLAKSDTKLSSLSEGTIIFTFSTFISFFLIWLISNISIWQFSNLVSFGNSSFKILENSTVVIISAPSFETKISPNFPACLIQVLLFLLNNFCVTFFLFRLVARLLLQYLAFYCNFFLSFLNHIFQSN